MLGVYNCTLNFQLPLNFSMCFSFHVICLRLFCCEHCGTNKPEIFASVIRNSIITISTSVCIGSHTREFGLYKRPKEKRKSKTKSKVKVMFMMLFDGRCMVRSQFTYHRAR